MSLPTHMNAVVIENYGSTDVLHYQTVPVPSVSDDELLVKVHSAGVSPFDVHVREGWYKDSFYTLPLILGWDLSGTVIAVGKDVSEFKVGDEIFAYPTAYRAGGCYAEYNVIKAIEAAHKPAAISHHQAVAAGMNALTAWQALFDAGSVTKGQRVLIQAAAGGIGHLAVQLARWKGAHVIGTASAKNAEFLADLGVDEFVDYTKTFIEKAIEPVDVVIDTVGGDVLKQSFSIVKKGGIVVTLVDFETIKSAESYGIQGKTVFVLPNQKQLEEIAQLLDQGILKPHVAAIFPLSEAAKAHQLVELGRTRGKIILETE